MVEELTSGKFNDFIKEGFVLIDFYADWCMPCVMMGPIVEEISEKMKDKIKVGKVNIEDNKELAQKYNIASIPNFVLIRNKKVIDQFVGAISKDELENKINAHIQN